MNQTTRHLIAGGYRALLFAALLAGGGCSGDGAGPAAPAHPWVRAPVQVDEKSVTLPAWLVYRVPEARSGEAIDALAAEPYIQISPSMAVHYTGEDVRVPATMRPFLVRAVAAGDGPIEVIQSLAGLWMKATAEAGASLRHQPLVVLIDPTPRDIFVTID